jgi:hypothetical protein
LIVPTAVFTDDHVPPDNTSESVVVMAVDKVVLPVIAEGTGFTDTILLAVLVQPNELVPVTV